MIMLLRIWRFIALILTALLVGTSFAHTLELPAKMQYPAPLYITLQKTLYAAWGPPSVSGFLEPAAILSTAVLAYLVRKRRPAFHLTLAATVCLLLAFPVVFFLFVEPANAVFRQATPESPPADWMRLRAQWEYGHAARFVLHLLGLSALALSVLRETGPERHLTATEPQAADAQRQAADRSEYAR
jgi:hypothetical protein